jgi:hypothetical protein
MDLSKFAARFRCLFDAPGVSPFNAEQLAAFALQGAEGIGTIAETRRFAVVGYVLSFVPNAERGPFSRIVAWTSNNDEQALLRAAAIPADEHDRAIVVNEVGEALLAASRDKARGEARRMTTDPALLAKSLGLDVRGEDKGGVKIQCPARKTTPHAADASALLVIVGGETRCQCASCGLDVDLFGLLRRVRSDAANAHPATLLREGFKVALNVSQARKA